MSYRIPGLVSFLAVALCAPAAAQAASPACSGDGTMTDSAGRTTFVRSGGGLTATVLGTDPDGTLRIAQHGQDHAALAVQTGRGGRLAIDQRGTSADADVVQGGACNAAELVQAGGSNRAAVSQSGSGNRAVVRQGSSKE